MALKVPFSAFVPNLREKLPPAAALGVIDVSVAVPPLEPISLGVLEVDDNV